MFSLTGVSLVAYLMRVVRDIAARNPRFRRSLGEVSLISGNRISFGDLQVIFRDIATQGHRSSFDYFVSTLTGRAILTQIEDKNGQFIEWISETDASGATPPAGVYYLNIDSVDEGTGAVEVTMETYRWYSGHVRNALGTRIVFASGIDASTVVLTDMITDAVVPTQAGCGFTYLLGYAQGLVATGSSNYTLLPLTDYWLEGTSTRVVVPTTICGTQTATIPTTYEQFSLVNQDGYTLRPGIDYIFASASVVQFAAWTPDGWTISITGTVKLDPRIAANLVTPENILNFTMSATDALAPGQVTVSTQTADKISLVVNDDSTVQLPAPLPPGGWCRYDLRVLTGQTQVLTEKNSVDNKLLPGLRIAIGDQVVAGDQCAIIVSPGVTETYRVYGDTPPVTFSIDVRANDPTTADELAQSIFQELLYKRREVIEADGLTLFDASSSLTPAERDASGTAPTYTVTLSFSGLATWRVFEPLVTRILNFDVTTNPTLTPFQGPLHPSNSYTCMTITGFLPDYR